MKTLLECWCRSWRSRTEPGFWSRWKATLGGGGFSSTPATRATSKMNCRGGVFIGWFNVQGSQPGRFLHGHIFPTSWSGLEKTSRISEFSGGRLFEKIEWGPPLKTEKLLWVMKKTEKARIEWGGSHSILATGARRNPELRGGSHSILSKRRPLWGGYHSILAKRQNPEYPEKSDFLSHSILSKKAAL